MSCQNNEIGSTFDMLETILYLLCGIGHIGDELSTLSWLRMKTYRKLELPAAVRVNPGQITCRVSQSYVTTEV